MDTTTKMDRRAKLVQTIEQAKAQLAAIEARESAKRRKLETRGAIVFSAFAAKAVPALLDQAIGEMEKKARTQRESLDLAALKAFKARGDG